MVIVQEVKLAFLDLDGTVLDENFSPKDFLPLIEKMKELGFKIILNSNKTIEEQLYFRKLLGIEDAFVVESGAAYLVPEGELPEKIGESFDGFRLMVLGMRIEKIEEKLEKIERRIGKIKRFTKMDPKEISEITGLPLFLAEKAKMRRFTEVIPLQPGIERIREEVIKEGLHWKPGRTLNVVGAEVDKGTATREIVRLYSKYYRVKSLAAGDSWTDVPMVNSVDLGFYICSKEPPQEVGKNVILVRSREELIEKLGEIVERF